MKIKGYGYCKNHIDDSLSFSELKTALSLIRGVLDVELADPNESVKEEKKKQEQLKEVFFENSKRAMAGHVEKYA